ncbi:MAG: hypothetical protein M5U01_33900 [Ardenticatenaceae bacterium]|nr:hypothetical protein [Ardenticatenaceae bacterium]
MSPSTSGSNAWPARIEDYFDLFDPACPPLPAGAQLPLVLVNGDLLSSGGQISMPAIRRRLEALGLQPSRERG